MAGDSAVVNAILARCLMDADFLDGVRRDPEKHLRQYDLAAETRLEFLQLDWTRLYNFAGFVTKVQHNQLWQTMPYTRALLKYYRIEIEIFAAYRRTHLRLRAATRVNPDDKIRSFIEFIDSYLASHNPDAFPGLRDIVCHERILWESELILNRPEHDPDNGQPTKVSFTSLEPVELGIVVPIVRGALNVRRYRYDPALIVARLNQGSFAQDAIPRRVRWLGYWADPAAGRLRVLELDRLSSAVLSLVDGRRSVRAIAKRLEGAAAKEVRARQVCAVLDVAEAQRVISVVPTRAALQV
jgi:hypothetical protein